MADFKTSDKDTAPKPTLVHDATSEHDTSTAHYGHDNLGKFRLDQAGGSGSENLERTSASGRQQAVDWKQEIQQAMNDVKILRQLDGQTGQVSDGKNFYDAATLRSQLVEDADKRFLTALPLVTQNAQGADAAMFNKLVAVDDVAARKQGAMQALGIPAGTQIGGDQLANAILNAPDQKTLNQLSELASLNEMERMFKEQGGEAAVSRHLPAMLGLEYADFLSRYKGGVTANPDQPSQIITAVDVLNQARNAEMIANPRAQDVAARTGDQQVQNQSLVIADDKNPLVALRQAMNSSDPKEAQRLAEQSVELAKGIDPKDCARHVTELQQKIAAATPDQVQGLQMQMASWDQLSHAGGLSEAYAGYFALRNGDHGKATDHLLKAAGDPTAVASMTDGRGQPLYDTLLKAALSGGKQDLGQTVTDVATLMNNAQQLAKQSDSEKDPKKKDEDLNNAIKASEQALQKASTLTTLAHDDAVKLDKQLQELNKKPAGEQSEADKAMIKQLTEYKNQFGQISQYQSMAMMSLAFWDVSKGDGQAAKKQLDDMGKLDNDYLKDEKNKKAYEELQQTVDKAIHNKEVDDKAWYDPTKWAEKGWDWIKDHGKMVALGVAAISAIGIGAICSATGVGATVGVPLMIAGGALIGTAAGAGAEMAGGHKDNFFSAAWDVAPSALTGSTVAALTLGTGVIGAGAAGSAEAAAAGGTEAALAGGAEATQAVGAASRLGGLMSNLSNPFAERILLNSAWQRGALIGAAGGLPWNLGEMRDNYAAGKYHNFGEALTDFGRNEAMFTVTGGTTGLGVKGFLAVNAAKNTVFEATNPYQSNRNALDFVESVAMDTGTDYLLGKLGHGKMNQWHVGGFQDAALPYFSQSTRPLLHGMVDSLKMQGDIRYFTPLVEEQTRQYGAASEEEIAQIKAAKAAAEGHPQTGAGQVAPTDVQSQPAAQQDRPQPASTQDAAQPTGIAPDAQRTGASEQSQQPTGLDDPNNPYAKYYTK